MLLTPKNSLFEKYISDTLSEKEKWEFDHRLENDKTFAEDFIIFLNTIKLMAREKEQSDFEFGFAMKHLTTDKVREITGNTRLKPLVDEGTPSPTESITCLKYNANSLVFNRESGDFEIAENWTTACDASAMAEDGFVEISNSAFTDIPVEESVEESVEERVEASAEAEADAEAATEKPSRRRRIGPYLGWAASIALLIIGSTFLFVERSDNRAQMFDMIADFNYVEQIPKSSGKLYESQERKLSLTRKEDIAEIKELYEKTPIEDISDKQAYGLRLVNAYLREHDRNKALTLLNELKSTYNFDPKFVSKCDRLIEQIKKVK